LTPKDVRCLAYDCAVKFQISYPNNWKINKMAGKDWLIAFLKKNAKLSIKKPEATSLGRITFFNKTNVNEFFNKLGYLLDKYKFIAKIWNIDETGVSNVKTK